MRGKLFYILTIIILVSISFVSPLDYTISPTSFTLNVKQDDTFSKTISYTIVNPQNTSQSAGIDLSNLPNFITSSKTSTIIIPANSQVSDSLILEFEPTTSTDVDAYAGSIDIGSQSISFIVNVQEKEMVGQCRIYTLPIPLTKTLEGGTTAKQSIDVYVSKYCSSALQVTTNQPQMTKPITFDSISGLVEPSQKFTLSVDYDSNDVQKGTYSDTIIVSAIDDDEFTYNLNLPISLTITSTISPITNGSFETMPSCSLSASEFYLNSSYKLICNEIPTNINIQPVIDYKYIKGVNVDETTSTYTYTIKPLTIGNTKIKANFLFKDATIGEPFEQEVRIIAGSTPLQGTNMRFKFYPELYNAKYGQNITVRVLDNSTNNILNDAKIYLNGNQISGSVIRLNKGISYELVASNYGYQDISKQLSLSNVPINFSVKKNYQVGDSLNFSTSPKDATILLNGKIINLPFKLTEEGVFKIIVRAVGYTTAEKNITVDNSVGLTYFTSDAGVKKGKEIVVELDKESSITIDYIDTEGKLQEVKDLNITSDSISFKADVGTYNIYSDGELVRSYVVPKQKLLKNKYFWIGLAVFVLLAIILLSQIESKDEDKFDYDDGSGRK